MRGKTRGDRTLGLGRNSRRKMDMGFKLMNSGGGCWAEAETQERGNHGIRVEWCGVDGRNMEGAGGNVPYTSESKSTLGFTLPLPQKSRRVHQISLTHHASGQFQAQARECKELRKHA